VSIKVQLADILGSNRIPSSILTASITQNTRKSDRVRLLATCWRELHFEPTELAVVPVL
jgi:hypothetical protein